MQSTLPWINAVILPGTLPWLRSLMGPSEQKRPKQSGINFTVFLQNPRKVRSNNHRASRTPCIKNKSKVLSKRQIAFSENARFQVIGKGKTCVHFLEPLPEHQHWLPKASTELGWISHLVSEPDTKPRCEWRWRRMWLKLVWSWIPYWQSFYLPFLQLLAFWLPCYILLNNHPVPSSLDNQHLQPGECVSVPISMKSYIGVRFDHCLGPYYIHISVPVLIP